MRRDMNDTHGSHHISEKTKGRDTVPEHSIVSAAQRRVWAWRVHLPVPTWMLASWKEISAAELSMFKVPGLKLLLRRTEDVLHRSHSTFMVMSQLPAWCPDTGWLYLPLLSCSLVLGLGEGMKKFGREMLSQIVLQARNLLTQQQAGGEGGLK